MPLPAAPLDVPALPGVVVPAAPPTLGVVPERPAVLLVPLPATTPELVVPLAPTVLPPATGEAPQGICMPTGGFIELGGALSHAAVSSKHAMPRTLDCERRSAMQNP